MELWNWFGRVADFLSVLIAIFTGYAFVKLRQQNKRLRELAKHTPPIENFEQMVEFHSGIKSSAPHALAVSLIPTNESLEKNVQTFLNHQGWKMPIETLNKNGIRNKEDMEDFVNELRQKRRLLDELGATELHLFVAAPMPMCIIIGAMLDNWIPVKLYHKPSPPPPQIYEYWLPII
jgi:hypothetical protein